MNLYKDYYKILKIGKSATIAQIKKSYVELAKVYHPDHNENSDDAKKMFQELKEAYDVLRNSKKEYDRNSPHVKKNVLDIEIDSAKTLKYEAYRGCKKCDGTGFDVRSDCKKCRTCNGRGFDDDTGYECVKCFGTGKSYDAVCPNCRGAKVALTSVTLDFDRAKFDGPSVTLKGHGHRNANGKAGDLVVILK